MAKRLYQDIQKAADQYLAIKANTLPNWKSSCECPDPGTRLECITCPAYRMLVKQMQDQLSPDGKEAYIPKLIPPKPTELLTRENRQHCIDLFTCGYSIAQIQWMLGRISVRKLQRWLRTEGLIGGCGDYTAEQRHQCLELYKSGLAPREIEPKTRVPSDVISDWVAQSKITRHKQPDSYSEADKQRCIDLYLDGNSCKKIAIKTGIPNEKIKYWIKKAGAKRKPVFGGGRPKIHSFEVRAKCLELFDQGKTANQIQLIMDVSADTLRRWRKEAAQQKENEPESI